MVTGNDQTQDGKVHSIGERTRRTLQIDRIEAYWNMVRGKRLVPSRSEIDPRGLDGVLGNSFVLERIAGGLARFRIAGSHLNEVTGLELRQMPLSALFLPGSREVLSDALQAVFDEPSVIRMAIASPGGFGRDRLEGELILLPLRSDLGDIDRVLGGIVFEGKIGRTPRRIEILGQTRRSLTGYAGTPTHELEPKPESKVIPAPVAPIAPRKPEIQATEPNRSHLRLVVSND